jgi:polyisoprenoid-binding protein YceI
MAATTWVLDPSHSEVVFKVKHLMITNVKGEFRKVEGTLTADGADFSNGQVNITIDPASIYTNDEGRDGHLKAADFFDAEQYKTITFQSTALTKKGDDFELKGNLTMKGVSKEITLDVEFGGVNKDPWGNEKAGFSVSGKINRKDWGLNWNAALETGGMLVSEEVRIQAEVQFKRG